MTVLQEIDCGAGFNQKKDLGRLLDRVQAGELGRPPGDASLASVRAGWL